MNMNHLTGASEERSSIMDVGTELPAALASAVKVFDRANNDHSTLQTYIAFAKDALQLEEPFYPFPNILRCDRFRKLVKLCELLDLGEWSKCGILARLSEVVSLMRASELRQRRDKDISVFLQAEIKRRTEMFAEMNQVTSEELPRRACIQKNAVVPSSSKSDEAVIAVDEVERMRSLLKRISYEKEEVARLRRELSFLSDIVKEHKGLPPDYEEAKTLVRCRRKQVAEVKEAMLKGRF